jgi:hypothetical protein
MSETVETPYADRKLGKKEARPDSIKLKLEDFVDKRRLRALRAKQPIRPKKVGHGGMISRKGWAILGNDRYGCCVWSGAAHETKLWTYEGSNKNTWFRDKDVLADYAQCTGFDPGKPETDVGTDMQKAAAYRRDTGIRDAYGAPIKSWLILQSNLVTLSFTLMQYGFSAQLELALWFLNPPWIRMPEATPGQ